MLFRSIFVLILLNLFSANNQADKQFYQEYQKYLISKTSANTVRKKLIEEYIYHFKSLTDRFFIENKRSLFTADTLYLISFTAAENRFLTGIIWSKKYNCYFQQTGWTKDGPWRKRIVEEKTDAHNLLTSFNPGFRYAIEKGDTASYHRYAITHKVLDGEYVSSFMVIKSGQHWVFIDFPGNGLAINYDF